MTPLEVAHTMALRELQATTDRLLASTATKEDVSRLETTVNRLEEKVDKLASATNERFDTTINNALNSAPPWAVRQIAWLWGILGTVTGAFGVFLTGLISRKAT